jgi:hypothetical protein
MSWRDETRKYLDTYWTFFWKRKIGLENFDYATMVITKSDKNHLRHPHLAKSASLTTRKKVANHSPWTPEVNKPQARISGVGISIPLQYIQTPTSRSLQVHLHLRFGLLPDRVQMKRGSGISLYNFAVDALAVLSDEHTPLSEISGLTSSVKGVYSAWWNDLILECSRSRIGCKKKSRFYK